MLLANELLIFIPKYYIAAVALLAWYFLAMALLPPRIMIVSSLPLSVFCVHVSSCGGLASKHGFKQSFHSVDKLVNIYFIYLFRSTINYEKHNDHVIPSASS